MFRDGQEYCGLVRSETFFPRAVNVELGLGGQWGGHSVFLTKEVMCGGGGMWLEIGVLTYP